MPVFIKWGYQPHLIAKYASGSPTKIEALASMWFLNKWHYTSPSLNPEFEPLSVYQKTDPKLLRVVLCSGT